MTKLTNAHKALLRQTLKSFGVGSACTDESAAHNALTSIRKMQTSLAGKDQALITMAAVGYRACRILCNHLHRRNVAQSNRITASMGW